MLSSYFETLAESYRMDEIGQAIVRCNNKQNGARTGRMSVTEPALQTIPREKGNVRGAFIAREGHTLVFIDYEGEELRVLGHFLAKVGDDSMKRVFEAGLDLHQEAASVIYKMPYDEVSKHGPNKWMRDNAKNVNFAIVYGAGQAKLASMLGVSLEEAKIMLRGYYNRFPGIWTLKKRTETAMKQRGYVVTPFGRRHREFDQRFAYKAVNSLIQGTSADINKAAMVKVRKAFAAEGLSGQVLLQIHDELIAEVPDPELEVSVQVMSTAMMDFPMLEIPLGVDPAHAKRWSEAK
jgi:DNA polymerase-1